MVSEKVKNAIEKGEMFPLMEHFYTIQGEGYNSGKPAYFIRLAGCDVGCHWCDVKESWEAGNHPVYDIHKIVDFTKKSISDLVVITGGEPVMYPLQKLTEELKKENKKLCLETSGAYPLTGQWDWICLSPKKKKPPLAEYYALANELKIIIYNKDDFNWAEKHRKLVNKNCKLYLQVEWSKSESMMPDIIQFVKDNPQWVISLQTHKYINVP